MSRLGIPALATSAEAPRPLRATIQQSLAVMPGPMKSVGHRPAALEGRLSLHSVLAKDMLDAKAGSLTCPPPNPARRTHEILKVHLTSATLSTALISVSVLVAWVPTRGESSDTKSSIGMAMEACAAASHGHRGEPGTALDAPALAGPAAMTGRRTSSADAIRCQP